MFFSSSFWRKLKLVMKRHGRFLSVCVVICYKKKKKTLLRSTYLHRKQLKQRPLVTEGWWDIKIKHLNGNRKWLEKGSVWVCCPTKYHSLDGWNHRSLFSHRSGGSGCHQLCLLPRPLSSACRSPHSALGPHIIFSLWVPIPGASSSSHKDTSHTGLI